MTSRAVNAGSYNSHDWGEGLLDSHTSHVTASVLPPSGDASPEVSLVLVPVDALLQLRLQLHVRGVAHALRQQHHSPLLEQLNSLEGPMCLRRLGSYMIVVRQLVIDSYVRPLREGVVCEAPLR